MFHQKNSRGLETATLSIPFKNSSTVIYFLKLLRTTIVKEHKLVKR
jgi:hypothetical protein